MLQNPPNCGILNPYRLKGGVALFTCSLCPHRCAARRDETVGEGRCGLPATVTVARAALHHGEEPCISGDDPHRGSGTVFFGGCTLSCAFCQNHTISRSPAVGAPIGAAVDAAALADIFRRLCDSGAYNINLVTPTPHLTVIREALTLFLPPVPVVYNTSGYERVETLRSLEGLVDVYLPDFKYADGALAAALSAAPDYPEAAEAAIREMARQTGALRLDEHGIAQRGTVVRHLVLPGHTRNSMRCLEILSTIPDIQVSLMFQYTPMADIPGFPALSRRVTARECDKVWDYLLELGLTDGYVQSRDSAGTEMIPSFDLTGVT